MKALHFFNKGWVAAVIVVLLTSCQIDNRRLTRGDGNLLTFKEEKEFFHSLEIQGMFDVELLLSDTLFASIEADSNLHDLIRIHVADSVLFLSTYGETLLRPTRLKILIGYSQLRSINIKGACELKAAEAIKADSLKVRVSGAADIDLELAVGSLTTQVSGAGKLVFAGEANKHTIRLSGASKLNAADLITQTTLLDMSGAGSSEVHATYQLDVNLSGVGTVRYLGNPSVRNLNISGLGEIEEVKSIEEPAR